MFVNVPSTPAANIGNKYKIRRVCYKLYERGASRHSACRGSATRLLFLPRIALQPLEVDLP
jgi:hypothetical protein